MAPRRTRELLSRLSPNHGRHHMIGSTRSHRPFLNAGGRTRFHIVNSLPSQFKKARTRPSFSPLMIVDLLPRSRKTNS